jgi:hypothetical protein
LKILRFLISANLSITVSTPNTFARHRASYCEDLSVLTIIKVKFLNGITIANFLHAMSTQRVKTCFTITFSEEQYERARTYVEDMKKHPNRVYWRGKEGKSEQELVIEQIAHRILSGFYNDDPFTAGKHIIRMDSAVNA